MFSFSAVLVTLLLFPALLSIFILRLFFPKNTLRVNEVIFFSFGLAVTLIFNLNSIFRILGELIPKCCIANDGFETNFYANVMTFSERICFEYSMFVFKPVIFFFTTILILRIIYVKANNLELKDGVETLKPWLVATIKRIGKFTNDNLVNYMGQMTVYHPKSEQLFVDVLDEGDSLYSGIFIEYFLDDKKFVGLKISNVIRYSFKSDKERMSEDFQEKDLPYILPNTGEMYFPAEKIKNLHFWKIEKGHQETFDLSTKYNQVRLAWMFGVRYSLPHLDINVFRPRHSAPLLGV